MEKKTYDLWVVGYGSEAYRKINWWTSFFVSKYIDQESLRKGQFYLLGSEKFLPNKWTLLYAGLAKDPQRIQSLRTTWEKLGQPSTHIWLNDPSLAESVCTAFADIPSENFKVEIADSLAMIEN